MFMQTNGTPQTTENVIKVTFAWTESRSATIAQKYDFVDDDTVFGCETQSIASFRHSGFDQIRCWQLNSQQAIRGLKNSSVA